MRLGFCDQGPPPRYVATATYTAECPGGTGTPVTVTRQAESCISMEEAQRKARLLAETEAKAEVQCTFAATMCVAPYPGTPEVCGSAISHVSLQDAQAQALVIAEAEAGLVRAEWESDGWVDELQDPITDPIDGETNDRILIP